MSNLVFFSYGTPHESTSWIKLCARRIASKLIHLSSREDYVDMENSKFVVKSKSQQNIDFFKVELLVSDRMKTRLHLKSKQIISGWR